MAGDDKCSPSVTQACGVKYVDSGRAYAKALQPPRDLRPDLVQAAILRQGQAGCVRRNSYGHRTGRLGVPKDDGASQHHLARRLPVRLTEMCDNTGTSNGSAHPAPAGLLLGEVDGSEADLSIAET